MWITLESTIRLRARASPADQDSISWRAQSTWGNGFVHRTGCSTPLSRSRQTCKTFAMWSNVWSQLRRLDDTITLSGARSRLDRRRFSRANTHFAASFKIYKKIIFSQTNLQNICKISQKFAKFWKKIGNFQNFFKILQNVAKIWEFFTEFCKILLRKL